jgi:outer membrane protein
VQSVLTLRGTVSVLALVLSLAAVATGARAQEVAHPPPPSADALGPMTIDQAVAIALEKDPVYLTQLLQARSATEDVRTAQSAILPNLSFNASYSRTRIGGGEVLGQFTTQQINPDGTTTPITITQYNPVQIFPGYGVGLSVRQLIFDGGKWWNNLAAFEKAFDVQREQAEEQRLQTVFTARQKFYELVRAQRQLEVLKESAKRSRDQADWTQRLYEGGRSTQADVYAARANRDNDEVNRLGQEAKVELARQDLSVAIGRDPTLPLAVIDPPELSQDPGVPPPMQESIDKALSRRPSLKAVQAQLEQNKKQIAAARGDYYPTVGFLGSYQRQTRSLDDFALPPQQANALQGSINLNWNLFAGYATDANVNRARIALQLTEVQYFSGRRGVASDVERAIASWAAARTQALVARQLEENAAMGLKLAKARQEVGVGTLLEVRDAELKVTQAQLSRVGSLVDGHEAEAAYRRAVGEI